MEMVSYTRGSITVICKGPGAGGIISHRFSTLLNLTCLFIANLGGFPPASRVYWSQTPWYQTGNVSRPKFLTR